jgi:hypothetical protein
VGRSVKIADVAVAVDRFGGGGCWQLVGLPVLFAGVPSIILIFKESMSQRIAATDAVDRVVQ